MSREKELGQMTLEELYPDLWCGKTCQEPSVQTKAKTSERSSKKRQKWQKGMPAFLDLRTANGRTPDVSWEMGGALLGEYTMHSFGEYPSEERESHLSQILQGGGAPEILFERESLPRNSEQSEEKREEVTGSIGESIDKAITFQERGGRPGGGKGILIQNDRTGALSTVNNQIVFNATTGSFMRVGNSGITETLMARDYKDPQIVCTSVVRRLTPMECERLQGFPDGWTDIGDWIDSKGKKHKGESDSPRYKALGNSIALPFWQWMARKMVKYIDGHQPTMASLFSGIGGFELVFARAGCKPVWNSEIESFPEAVTRVHFGDDDTREVGDYERYL